MSTNDAEAVARALIDAESRGDVEGAVALFHTDAVCNDASGTHTGEDEIRAWQVGLAANHFHATIGALTATEGTVTFDGSLTFDRFTQMGIDGPLTATWELEVDGGRIRTFTFAFSPESLARLQAAQQ